MKLDQARMKRRLMLIRDKLLLNGLPGIGEASERLARASRRAFSACKQHAPNLRQVSGLVMIVNTFLPAIVVLALGLMIWSTAGAIKRDACLTAAYVTQALADDNEQKRYAAAADKDARERVLAALVKRLREGPPTAGGPCEAWKDVRKNIKHIVVDELYGKAVTGITNDIRAVAKDFDRMKTAVQEAVPSIDLIKYAGVPLVDQAIWAANQVVKVIRDALGVVGNGLKAVGSYLASPLIKAQGDLSEEFQKIDYKRAAAWALIDYFLSDIIKLFTKFKWFFIVLTTWLVLTYVLWMYRRLAVGWALLRNRDAI